MPDIVLCATQRCGSTMIVEDLRNSGVLGHPEEWFIPWNPAKSGIDWSAELETLRQRATSQNGVMSVKVMANQLSDINSCLSKGIGAPPFVAFHRAFESATWVWLWREDIVSQAVSRIMAQQTGINHATAGADHFAGNLIRGDARFNYNADATYNFAAIAKACTAITLENLCWSRFFAAHNIKPLVISHEDVITNPNMIHLDQVAAAAGITEPLAKTARKMVKLGNARNFEFVNRFYCDAAEAQFRLKNQPKKDSNKAKFAHPATPVGVAKESPLRRCLN